MSNQSPKNIGTRDQENTDQQCSTIPLQSNHRVFKILFLMAFLLFFCVLGFMGKNYLEYLYLSEPERISFLWKRDMSNLKQIGSLPLGLEQLKSIKVISTSKLTKLWKTLVKVPFATRKEGKYHLEILIIGLEEAKLRGAILQMNLTTKKDDNHVWEMGRTYSLKLTNTESSLKKSIDDLIQTFK